MPPQIGWPSAERQAHFERWLAGVAGPHGLDTATLRLASADASFRRYLRVQGRQGSLIVMDAPPPLEDVRPFVHVAGLIARAGLHAPRVLQADAGQGFLLLTDLGDAYLQALQAASEAQADRADAPGAVSPGPLAAGRRGRSAARLRCGPDRPRAGAVSAVVRAARVRPDLDAMRSRPPGPAWWICSRATCWPSPWWPCTATGCRAT
jgi:hypothetical protein